MEVDLRTFQKKKNLKKFEFISLLIIDSYTELYLNQIISKTFRRISKSLLILLLET